MLNTWHSTCLYDVVIIVEPDRNDHSINRPSRYRRRRHHIVITDPFSAVIDFWRQNLTSKFDPRTEIIINL